MSRSRRKPSEPDRPSYFFIIAIAIALALLAFAFYRSLDEVPPATGTTGTSGTTTGLTTPAEARYS